MAGTSPAMTKDAATPRFLFTSCNVAPRAIAFGGEEHRLQCRDGVHDPGVVDLELSLAKGCGGKGIEIRADVIGLRHVEGLRFAVLAAEHDLGLGERLRPHVGTVDRAT